VHDATDREKLVRIFLRHRTEFIGSQLVEECSHDRTKLAVSQAELIHCLSAALVDDEDFPCVALAKAMCQIDVPFIIVANEIAYLRDALIRAALREADLRCVSYAVEFFDTLEDNLASVFLESFLDVLKRRNGMRLEQIARLSEKNLLAFFESHLHWMERLTAAVAQRDLAAMPELDHERCAFGTWLHEEGPELIRDRAHYQHIVDLHRAMHQVAAEMKSVIGGESGNLPVYALLKKAENYSLDLGNQIAMLNCMVIMSVYSKDPMTGLLTRRTLDRIMITQLEVSRATETPFCLLMCDIDHFKRINDEHGHPVGDRAILHFVKLVRESVRQSDMVFRFGGEEFLIVLPSTTYEQGMRLAEQIRARLNATPMQIEGKVLEIRASFGLLEGNGNKVSFIDDTLVQELIKECDQRLYLAKHRGRNQVA
jgi:diguanylate cyclase (GGDEF)-like protein